MKSSPLKSGGALALVVLLLASCESSRPSSSTDAGDPDASDALDGDADASGDASGDALDASDDALDASDDALDASDAADASDADGPDQVCPVVGYAACGGELAGTWSFLALCPEDPEAAAALCESPYDDRPECVEPGNESICDSTYTGTLTFDADGTMEFATENRMIVTWRYTDTCLEAVRRESTPLERCEAMTTERVSCEYGDVCVCVSLPIIQRDEGSGAYTVTDDQVVIGDDPPATYCVDGDRLVMDYSVYHPVSWRYWVLERP